MTRVLSTATTEFRIALRNRWVAIVIVLMVVFSVVLAAAGSAPSGALGADRLSVTVASLTSLAVYLVPLVALLMAFDAVAGEVERGTLSLLLAYPLTRLEVLLGKLMAHLTIIAAAVTLGYGAAAVAAAVVDPASVQGLAALWRLIWSSVLLGATFLAAGYALSALAQRPAGAAGLAIALWLMVVVLYDLVLLVVIVVDEGGTFTTAVFPWLLSANPADAFRLFNLSASEATAAASGLAGAAATIPVWQALASLVFWPVATLALAVAAFGRVST